MSRRAQRRKTFLLASTVVVGLSLCVTAAAEPPSFAQVAVTYNGNHSAVLPLAAPSGVLLKVSDAHQDNPDDLCPANGSDLWYYDSGPLRAGDALSLVGFGYVGGSFTASLSLPGHPPFEFAGNVPANSICADEAIAFVAPSDNTYRLDFGISAGNYQATLADRTVDVSAPLERDIAVETGVNVVSIRVPGGTNASWSITGDDLPPSISFPSEKRRRGVPGFTNTFSVGLSESGRVEAAVSRRGRVVRELVSNDSTPSGGYRLAWDGTLSDGSDAPLGNYTVRITETDWKGRTATHDFEYALTLPPVEPAWQRAAAQLAMPILRPSNPLGLRLKSLSTQRNCGGGSKEQLDAMYADGQRQLQLQEGRPAICANLGMVSFVRAVSVHGHRAVVTANCDPDACVSKPSYNINWRERGIEITMLSSGLFVDQLVTIARSARPIR